MKSRNRRRMYTISVDSEIMVVFNTDGYQFQFFLQLTLNRNIRTRSAHNDGIVTKVDRQDGNWAATPKHLVQCKHTDTATSPIFDDLLSTETHLEYASAKSYGAITRYYNGCSFYTRYSHLKRTLNPSSLFNSSAFNAEQLTVWYANSVAAVRSIAGFENSWSSDVSIFIVLINCLYPAYLYGCKSTNKYTVLIGNSRTRPDNDQCSVYLERISRIKYSACVKSKRYYWDWDRQQPTSNDCTRNRRRYSLPRIFPAMLKNKV